MVDKPKKARPERFYETDKRAFKVVRKVRRSVANLLRRLAGRA